MNIISQFFPKTWKFISIKGSIKNFYKFDINPEETSKINSKFTENKIDFFNVKYLTPIHIQKTAFTFYGMSTSNIINDDLQYLNMIDKIKNILLMKIKLSKSNSKIKIYINNNDFRIPVCATAEFCNMLNNDFEIRFANYLKILLNYEYLIYRIFYKDMLTMAPIWSAIGIPISFLIGGENGESLRERIMIILPCYLIIGIILLYYHDSAINEKLKEFGYFEKYKLSLEIIKEEKFTISKNINKLKSDLLFINTYIKRPILEENIKLIEENLIMDKLLLLTSELDEIVSQNIDKFLIYLI